MVILNYRNKPTDTAVLNGGREMLNITGMPKEVKLAAKAVISARKEWNRIDSIDRATKQSILNNKFFVEEDSKERITDVSLDFLMSTEDFKQYCELVYELNLFRGIDSGSPETNFYSYKKAVYDAENAFIDAVAKDIPQYTKDIIDSVKKLPSRRKEFLSIAGL